MLECMQGACIPSLVNQVYCMVLDLLIQQSIQCPTLFFHISLDSFFSIASKVCICLSIVVSYFSESSKMCGQNRLFVPTSPQQHIFSVLKVSTMQAKYRERGDIGCLEVIAHCGYTTFQKASFGQYTLLIVRDRARYPIISAWQFKYGMGSPTFIPREENKTSVKFHTDAKGQNMYNCNNNSQTSNLLTSKDQFNFETRQKKYKTSIIQLQVQVWNLWSQVSGCFCRFYQYWLLLRENEQIGEYVKSGERFSTMKLT